MFQISIYNLHTQKKKKKERKKKGNVIVICTAQKQSMFCLKKIILLSRNAMLYIFSILYITMHYKIS